jgi:hypothetical protein
MISRQINVMLKEISNS